MEKIDLVVVIFLVVLVFFFLCVNFWVVDGVWIIGVFNLILKIDVCKFVELILCNICGMIFFVLKEVVFFFIVYLFLELL